MISVVIELSFIFTIHFLFLLKDWFSKFQQPDSEKAVSNGNKKISPEQDELIHRLVYFQTEHEHPPEEDVKRIIVSSLYIQILKL